MNKACWGEKSVVDDHVLDETIVAGGGCGMNCYLQCG